MKKIFIGGCDRSGTTFLAGLLSSYKDVVMTPESHFKNTAAVHSIIEHCEYLSSNWRFRTWFDNPDSMFDKAEIASNYDELYQRFVLAYAKLSQFNEEKIVWVDHTPENLQYAKFYDQCFSNLRFIHIVRDVRGVAASIKDLEWGPNTPEAISKYWLQRLSYGFCAEINFKALRVKYEDLICNTEQEMEKIVNFVGLNTIKKNKSHLALPRYTLNQHKLVGEKPDASRVNAWENKLSSYEIDVIVNETKEMLDSLDYEVSTNTTGNFVYRKAFDLFKEVYLKGFNRLKYNRKRM